MIRPKIWNFDLDIKRKTYMTNITPKQGDIQSNVFRINLFQGAEAYDLTGLSVKAYFKRPDEAVSFIDGVVTGALEGKVEITLTNQILNLVGAVECELLILGSAGEALSTVSFKFEVLSSLDYTEVESNNEFNALVTALGEVQNINNRFSTIESRIEDVIQSADLDPNKDIEVVDARFGKPTLGAKIGEIDAQLNEIVHHKTGLNKFNKLDDTIITGYYISQSGGNEVISTNATYGITPYMPIKPNTRYFNNSLSNFKTNIFYDINKNMIGYTLNNDFSVDTLSDVAYVRCNFLLTEIDTLMFYEYDGEPKPYEPYKLIPVLGDNVIIPPEKIPELVAKVNDPLANYKRYYNALLNGENEIYNINVIGDSISSGAVAGAADDDYYKYSYLGLIRSKLAELFSDTGYGFIPCFHLAPQVKFVTTGVWSKNYTLMGVGQLSWYTYETGASVSFPFKGTGVALMVRGTPTRGTVGVSIDGGAQQIVNLAYPEALIKFEKIEGLADGDHTCVITNLEAKEFLFFGAYEIKGTKGFRVNFCGRSGQATPQFAYNDSVMSAEIDIFQPVLTVIASITNDIGLSLDLTTYRNNLQTLVTRAKQYGDVILMANNGRTDKSHAIQLPYVNAMKDIADKNNCLFVDMYRRWDREAPTMGYMADTLHQNALGHTDMANALLSYLEQ